METGGTFPGELDSAEALRRIVKKNRRPGFWLSPATRSDPIRPVSLARPGQGFWSIRPNP